MSSYSHSARDAVERPQDFPGLPLVGVEQMLEVARRLVQVEHQGEIDLRHRLISEE
jgi:hypothetical protein